jgi:hypothetical protein
METCYVVLVTIVPPADPRPQNRRRSKRVQTRIPVTVRLRDAAKRSTSEKTEAIIVNDHGALILLAARAEINQIIRVENPSSGEELLCRVTSLGDSFMGKTQVGVEFVVPTPGFWRVASKTKDRESRPALKK